MPHLNPAFGVETPRLRLTPVAPADLPDIAVLKADPAVFGRMLHGCRSAEQAAADLSEDRAAWLDSGVGIWCVRRWGGSFVGICGFAPRPDGLGMALRYAIVPGLQGQGYAREAAAAALGYARARTGLLRVVAVAEEANAGSVKVLLGIGMRFVDCFDRAGRPVLVFESRWDRDESGRIAA